MTTLPAGGTVTVNGAALNAEAEAVETRNGPVVAPVGTITLIWVGETTDQTVAATPLNWMPVIPEKLLPETTTLVPTGPLDGEKPEMAGGGMGAATLMDAAAEVPTAPWLSVARASSV
jgi:hypothetical protein